MLVRARNKNQKAYHGETLEDTGGDRLRCKVWLRFKVFLHWPPALQTLSPRQWQIINNQGFHTKSILTSGKAQSFILTFLNSFYLNFFYFKISGGWNPTSRQASWWHLGQLCPNNVSSLWDHSRWTDILYLIHSHLFLHSSPSRRPGWSLFRCLPASLHYLIAAVPSNRGSLKPPLLLLTRTGNQSLIIVSLYQSA